jgi:hypothetical protein
MGIPLPPGAGNAVGTPPAGDIATEVVTGQIGAVGVGLAHDFYGSFNVVIWGAAPTTAFDATVQLERSFDGGATWFICGVGGAGQPAIYVGSVLAGQNVSIVVSEPERGVAYRLHVPVYGSGTINYRMSASGLAAMAWGVPPG